MDKTRSGVLRGVVAGVVVIAFLAAFHSPAHAKYNKWKKKREAARTEETQPSVTETAPAVQSPAVEKEAAPSKGEITRPDDSVESVMDEYNRRLQQVVEQSDPPPSPETTGDYSDAEAMKNNKEYQKAMELYLKLAEQTNDPAAYTGAAASAQGAGLDQQAITLADEALARYDQQVEAMLIKAKSQQNLDQFPEARRMLEKAMETMAKDGTAIDPGVLDLYKELLKESAATPEGKQP